MKTEVFENYEEFENREDVTINGVSRKVFENIYAWENPVIKGLIRMRKDNVTNIGCWNCVDCTNCVDCHNLDNCHNCSDCEHCKDSTNLVNCHNCHHCDNCHHCHDYNNLENERS